MLRQKALGLALCLTLAACGQDDPAPEVSPAPEALPPGFWFQARTRSDVDLGGLGYASGTRAADEAAVVGARVLAAEAMAPGANLYCSGHAPEARLVDANGELLASWRVDYEALEGVPPLVHDTQRAWRRVRRMPDGGLLALHEALALLRLDSESNLLWAVGEGAHHDFDVDAEGRIHVLDRRAIEHPELAAGRTIVDDGVRIVRPDGSLGARFSILEALYESPWRHLLLEAAQAPYGRTIDPGTGTARDLLHVNAYALLADVPPGLDPVFQPGRALVCMRELGVVALFDPVDGRLVWLFQGSLDGPHDPELDDQGRLWIFDNGLQRDWSRAVAIDLVAGSPTFGREVAQWPPSRRVDFHSEVCGALQLLPGGNLLLTESTAGRAWEVTPQGEVVWTFTTPHRVEGPEGPLVACLFELERLAGLSGEDSGRDAPGADGPDGRR